MLNQLDSIYNKLTSMYNENLSCPNKTIIVNFNNLISSIKTTIEQTLNLLRAGNISVNNFNSNIYSIDTQLKKLYQDTINAIQTYNMNNNAKNTMDNQLKNEFNKNNIIKSNNMFCYNQDMMTINKVRPNAIAMRDRMLTKDTDPHATALQIKLTDKWEELQNRFKDARTFAKHRKISDQPIQNIENKFFIDYTNLDPFNKDVATIQQAITLIDNNIKLLNEFTFDNDFTVVIPNQTSD